MGSFLPPINQSVPASNCFGEIDMDEVKIIFDRKNDVVDESQFANDNPFAMVDQNKSMESPKKRETGGFGFELNPTQMLQQQEPQSESSYSSIETPQPDIMVKCKCKATVLLVDDSLF